MDRYITRINIKPEEDKNKSEAAVAAHSNLGSTSTSILLQNTEEDISSTLCENDEIMERSESEEENSNTGNVTVNRNKKKSYKQKFREEWIKKFGNWLTHEVVLNEKVAYCKVCSKILKGGITHIQRHSQSFLHCKNLKAAEARPSKSIKKLLMCPKKEALSKQVKAAELKMVFFLADHNLPFRLLDHLPKFIASVCPDSTIAKSIKCQRKKGASLCLNEISPAQLNTVITDLNKYFFSLIVDETTDVSVTKSLVLVARYYKNYKVIDTYLNLLEVKDGSAQSLYDGIIDFFNKNNVNFRNMLGFAADNASVMQGNKAGLKKKFEQLIPHVFVLGCVCHSFNLCSSAACTKLPKTVEKFCRDVCNYFAHSSIRSGNLIEFQELCKTASHRILKLSQTRWLSMQDVVNRILEQWQPLILFFTAECSDKLNADTAELILSALKNPVFKLYFLFLSYSLEMINKLNCEFQSEGIKIHCLLERIKTLYKTLLQNFIKSELIEEDLNNLDVSNPRFFLKLENMYFGAQCELLILETQIEISELNNFKLRCLEFYIELSKQIKARFNFQDEVLNFAKILDPKVVFSQEFSSIVPIIHRFPILCNMEEVEKANAEWRHLQRSQNLFNNYESVDEFWRQVFLTKNGLDELMFPNLKKIISGLMCLPHSSASAERIFSQFSLIKTKHRNRLQIKTCDALLHTKEMLKNSTCYDFQPPDSILNNQSQSTSAVNTIDDSEDENITF